MQKFEDRDDVQEWLDTLDYDQFWAETDPLGLNAEERANCDASIASGVDKELILRCIKSTKRLEIIREQNLPPRFYKDRPTLH